MKSIVLRGGEGVGKLTGLGGGGIGTLGEEASPAPPSLDETLQWDSKNLQLSTATHSTPNAPVPLKVCQKHTEKRSQSCIVLPITSCCGL